ncbi:MAG TPA: bifunctional diaminohydroxyphosphoribosylaminopyrimidine deaminase/5-amino-6-(5-phosphoribosylamino)uracil reductase RibD [candidate division Zixibacteria bacterium]|nr:bifunctional diaminohydroxyphosphoribosylaminopyrimidine deaminase/5-amino-6-(5-phosphoribosylamino)uracil reductase RibD [candidate division Zixibacteria bacterium]
MSKVYSQKEIAFMRRALALARKGLGQTSPNPMVGAAVVKAGRIVGLGYHRRAGEEHAEVIALKEAGQKARGSILFVNLEPCSHYGRTAPCVEAIAAAGVKKVYASVIDPNPLVNGKGIEFLRKRKVEVKVGFMADEARKLNEVHFKVMQKKLPFVTLKFAQSLDGRIATKNYDSRWITGEPARRFAHFLRATHDAVLVGRKTVEADDPQLTVRMVKGKNPWRLVLDTEGKLRSTARLVRENEDGKTVLLFGRSDLSNVELRGEVAVWPVGLKGGRIDLRAALETVLARGITSVLVEGGAGVLTNFFKEKLADKVYVATAPMIIGEGISAIGNLGVEKLSKAIRFERVQYKKLGQDFLFSGYPICSPA